MSDRASTVTLTHAQRVNKVTQALPSPLMDPPPYSLHPLINLQLPREGLVTLATKTVATTPQNRGVASKLSKSIAHFCLMYNVTVLIHKLTKAAQVLLLHKSLFHSVVACLSSTRMLFAHQQTSENEQTKAYITTTVLEWAERHVTMDSKNFLGQKFLS